MLKSEMVLVTSILEKGCSICISYDQPHRDLSILICISSFNGLTPQNTPAEELAPVMELAVAGALQPPSLGLDWLPGP